MKERGKVWDHKTDRIIKQATSCCICRGKENTQQAGPWGAPAKRWIKKKTATSIWKLNYGHWILLKPQRDIATVGWACEWMSGCAKYMAKTLHELWLIMGKGGQNHPQLQRSGAAWKAPQTQATSSPHGARKREARQSITGKSCSSPKDSRGRPHVERPQPKETGNQGRRARAPPWAWQGAAQASFHIF